VLGGTDQMANGSTGFGGEAGFGAGAGLGVTEPAANGSAFGAGAPAALSCAWLHVIVSAAAAAVPFSFRFAITRPW
jgi:hypothetical protein